MRPTRARRAGLVAFVMAAMVACLALAPAATAMGVVGIDYGTESIKVSLVKPGKPFDIVLSRDSKRKIPAAVAWKDMERLYGSDALNLLTRFPGDTFIGAKFLLGRGMEDKHSHARQRQSDLLGTDLVATSRGTVAVRRATDYTLDNSGPDVYSAEEIVGWQLSHARTLAEETAEEEVARSYPGTIGRFGGLDVVITVPIFFTAGERLALFNAAEIAGFRPKLVSDGAAAAINYAMARNFPTTERHLFYDSGAGSTRATIVEISTQQVPLDPSVSLSGGTKESVVIDVIGAGWDREANGFVLDRLVRDAMAKQFEAGPGAKLGKSVFKHPRAMARLLKEAVRVKHILSVNQEALFSIEGLIDEIDFRGKVSRAELEQAAKALDLEAKFSSPITDALADANLKVGDLTSVVLVGGNSRVPLVQAAIRDAGVPDDKIAVNVNADEAAVMGAAFYGASYIPSFKVKPILTNDANPYPIVVKDPITGKDDLLFDAAPLKNESAVRYYSGLTSDFGFDAEYAPSSQARLEAFDKDVYRFEVAEVDSHLALLKSTGEISQVDVDFNLTITHQPIGVLNVQSAFMNVKQKPGGVVGALKSFFGGGSSSKTEESTANATDANSTSTNSTDGADKADNSTAKVDEPTDRSIQIVSRAVPRGDNRPLSGEQLKAAKDRLYIADVAARSKAAKEEARNLLEAYIYRARDVVEEERFKGASKKEERERITKLAEELGEWLNEGEGDKAETSVFKSKRADLEKLVEPVLKRISERGGREAALLRFDTTMEDARTFVAEARRNLTEALQRGEGSKYSVTDLDSLESNVERERKWMDKGKKEQEKRKEDEDPAVKVEDMERRSKRIRDNVERLRKRKITKTKPPKKEKKGDEKGKKEEKGKQDEKKKDEGKKEEDKKETPPHRDEL